MAIVGWPNKKLQRLQCAICSEMVDSQNATVGPLDKRGERTFACEMHSETSTQLIKGWVRFSLLEQCIMVREGMNEGAIR